MHETCRGAFGDRNRNAHAWPPAGECKKRRAREGILAGMCRLTGRVGRVPRDGVEKRRWRFKQKFRLARVCAELVRDVHQADVTHSDGAVQLATALFAPAFEETDHVPVGIDRFEPHVETPQASDVF